jgi:hypothetical protein
VTWGYGALISDVRAAWENGQHLDALQKIYPVCPWMMAGFAGSVEFGFQRIANMQEAFGPLIPDHAWMPQIAWRWHLRARRAFARAPARIQRLYCSILLVGASPLDNSGIPWARCIRMNAPLFIPERARPFAWLSIGTGASHRLASEFANQNLETFWNFGQAEVNNPGGMASTLASAVAGHLARNPETTVSPQLQVGTAWRGRHDLRTLKGEFYGAWTSWALVSPTGLAGTWDEFVQIAGDAGLSATAAVT